ncbi:type II toxin-antitoxin system RelE/ParE family toxin [Oleomonas cavernae]|uniref:Type II toxin-antitoxin system RelE/ParE family toxin n=1 Tax=Oleomonas cavernae TaxID=2320859 RepID=A0A418WHN5_9PROT|nr:type II toxin-antitoxin system RelE/ParE family toxin [Oleomonas cavernae]RJF89508.1 type II toxin-antitoxin system RelE/ParE family toxin [Oleomonas cavernae]
MTAKYRLSAAAREDIVELLAWTDEHFGELARLRYERLLATALRDVAADPERPGSIKRPDLGEQVRSYHLRHSRERARHESGIVRNPRHFLLYRAVRSGVIGVGRVLYDAMDLERHLPSAYGDE